MSFSTVTTATTVAATSAPASASTQIRVRFDVVLPQDLFTDLPEYLDAESCIALIRTNRKCQQHLSEHTQIGDHVRSSLMRFIKGRLSVAQPHASQRHLRKGEKAILLKFPFAKFPLFVDFSGIRIKPERLEKFITAFPEVCGINLDHSQTNDDCIEKLLPSKDKLHSLSVRNHGFDLCGVIPCLTNVGVSIIAQNFFQLRSLTIGGYHILAGGLARLGNLKKLESLTLFDDARTNVTISKEVIEHFASLMPNLTRLSIQDWTVSTQALEAIASFINLQTLGLTHAGGEELPDDLIGTLASMPNLHTVYIYDTPDNRTWGEMLLQNRNTINSELEKLEPNKPTSPVDMAALNEALKMPTTNQKMPKQKLPNLQIILVPRAQPPALEGEIRAMNQRMAAIPAAAPVIAQAAQILLTAEERAYAGIKGYEIDSDNDDDDRAPATATTSTASGAARQNAPAPRGNRVSDFFRNLFCGGNLRRDN